MILIKHPNAAEFLNISVAITFEQRDDDMYVSFPGPRIYKVEGLTATLLAIYNAKPTGCYKVHCFTQVV